MPNRSHGRNRRHPIPAPGAFGAFQPGASHDEDALSPHAPSPLPADADATVTDTDIVYLADLQPQPVEWLWQYGSPPVR